jgi:hypothetical protein
MSPGNASRLMRLANLAACIRCEHSSFKIEAQYRSRLRTCSEAEAVSMLDRFAPPEIAAFAVRESKEDSIRAAGL